jgi:hypothetical protein
LKKLSKKALVLQLCRKRGDFFFPNPTAFKQSKSSFDNSENKTRTYICYDSIN